MFVGGVGAPVATPSAAAIQREAAGGRCESYPLTPPSADPAHAAVRLYIDEIGALRGRPRNVRAEQLAQAAGLAGLAIHGDAYVGRCGAAHNLDFRLGELAHDSAWVAQARAANLRRAAEASLGETEHLPGGGDEAGPYSWTQTDEDVEVRVRCGLEGKGAARRVKVGFGSGASLTVAVDGKKVLSFEKLFARVLPDECNWTIDGEHVVISMEKADHKPWAGLGPLGSE
ncbi:hypothetical protein AB1Y20_010574 [Prymnesium parvum]|uniref:CS domain-containing protein n=1 Tax=Prymnesium parvum TaxID=97485 RepID=A0AB34IQ61_PRYPA